MTSANLIEKCCLVCDSVAGDPTHFAVEQALARLGLEWTFLSFEVPRPQLAEALRGVDVLGFRGVLLAGSFRQPASDIGVPLAPRAERSGIVTALVRHDDALLGDDLVQAALIEQLGSLDGAVVAVVGSGVAARSAIAAAVVQGASTFHIAADSEIDFAAVAERLGQLPTPPTVTPLSEEFGTLALPANCRVLVHARELAREADLDLSAIDHELMLVETELASSPSPLVRHARHHGWRVIDGAALLVAELVAALQEWSGARCDPAVIREAVDEYLGI